MTIIAVVWFLAELLMLSARNQWRPLRSLPKPEWGVTEVTLIAVALVVGGVIGPHLLLTIGSNSVLASWDGVAVTVIVAACLFAAQASYRHRASRVWRVSEAVFDELIHAPLRLQICAMLSPVRSLPFSDIRDSLEVSDSVLSKHLSALAGAGYVEVSRVRADSRSRRQVILTNPGRTALRGHLAALQAIAATAVPTIAAEPSGVGAAERPQVYRKVALDPGR